MTLLLWISLALSQGSDTPAPPIGPLVRTYEDVRRPTALAHDRGGDLWVIDADTDEIVRFLPTGEERTRIDDDLPWSGLRGVAASTRLYLADAGRERVVAVDVDPSRPAILMEGPQQSPDPRGIDVNARGVAVVDARLQRVLQRGAGPWRAIGEGRLVLPTDVALADDGRLFVLDRARATVEVFDAEGAHLRAIGGWGIGHEQLIDPTAVEVVGERLLIADPGAQAVRVFTLDGAPVGDFAPGAETVGGALGAMQDLSVSPDGRRLAVSEPALHRVREFAVGDLTRSWHTPSPVGTWRRLGLPGWNEDTLVVADTAGRRLLRVTLPREGRAAAHVALASEALGPLWGSGVHLDPGGVEALVADRASGKLYTVDVRDAGKVLRTDDLAARVGEGVLAGRLPLDLVDVTRAGRATFVLCARNRCVIELDPEGRPRAVHETFALPLRRPVAVTASVDGRLLVTDAVQGAVVGLDERGDPLPAYGRGRLTRPYDATLDREGRVMVMDRSTGEGHLFAPGGRRLEHDLGLAGAVAGTTLLEGSKGRRWLFVPELALRLERDASGAWARWDDLGPGEELREGSGPQPLPLYDPTTWAW